MSVLTSQIRDRMQWLQRHDRAMKAGNPLMGFVECVIFAVCLGYLFCHYGPTQRIMEVVLSHLRSIGII
ncbi:MAG: hypothetical protein E4H02_09390 [Lentisphaerales bacterium]|jgi:ABC-type nitrate/sulfonate/bicarbonate transport system permease component|nr:MAG: hypothetical protein E4H02_09390 [Lentisphaerales bacterium]